MPQTLGIENHDSENPGSPQTTLEWFAGEVVPPVRGQEAFLKKLGANQHESARINQAFDITHI